MISDLYLAIDHLFSIGWYGLGEREIVGGVAALGCTLWVIIYSGNRI